MWTLLKQLWTDPAKFTAVIRALIAAFGAVFASGNMPASAYAHIPWWVGLVVMGASQGISSGDKNVSVAAQLKVDHETEKANTP